MSDAPPGYPRLLPLGDGAWTVEFAERIDPAVHGRVMALAALLDGARHGAPDGSPGGDPDCAGIVDVVPTFRSLTVHYQPLRIDGERLGRRLLALAHETAPLGLDGRCWRLPACFDGEFAPDLAAVAERHGRTPGEVVERLCGAAFRVYMIGFMPGFPYMGGLPAELATPRLASPRKAVPARSIAIAGEMCAVYPWNSPGGWNLLGRTPLDLFVAGEDPPALLAAGDTVRWTPVDRRRYGDIERALACGEAHRRDFLDAGGA